MSLLLSFYGDDFTGSTDVLETLSLAGVETALFMKPPSAERLAQFPELQALGVAGTSRSWSPERMRLELPEVFTRLQTLGAPTTLYKICSTFDSSPEVGSIGVALELGREVFGPQPTPLLAAAPRLGRYCVFGNLFARALPGGPAHRLDRHPTMRFHPVTPMAESDLRLHLAEQTSLRTALLDVLSYAQTRDDLERSFEALAQDAEVVLFDALEEAHLERIGALLAAFELPFAVGSSGLAHALALQWAAEGKAAPRAVGPLEATDRLLVLSGSCSPVSAAQLLEAQADGFELIALDTPRLLGEEGAVEAGRVLEQAVASLEQGKSVALHSCLGPDDPRIAGVRSALSARGLEPRLGSARALGTKLGELLRGILEAEPASRVIVAGGDTSGYVALALGLTSLRFKAPLAPGGPLCRAGADGPLDGLEVAFKGGQTGSLDLYVRALRGAP